MTRSCKLSLMLAVVIAQMSANACAMSCVVESAPQFNFGQYDPLSATPLDVHTTFLVQCTPAFRGELLNLQVSFAGITAGQLNMRNAATGDILNFGIYRDPSRIQALDAQSVVTFISPLLATTTIALPVYGRVPARQPIAVGNYQLNVTVILRF